MVRPVGIKILAALILIAAVILFLMSVASFFVGLAFLLPFPAQGTTLLLNAVLFFVIAVVLGLAGSGLMRMRPWAWGLAVLAALVILVYLGYSAYQNSAEGLRLSAILTLAVVGAVFVYLLSVVRSFRRPEPTK